MKDLQILNGIQPKQEKQAEQEEPATQSFLLNWNFPMADDDEYTTIYRKPKAITPDLPAEEPDNSLSMGDEHLNPIPETEKSNVKNLVPIPSESKGISDDIYDVPSCDNDHFDAEFGLINSLLNRDISITSPKIDFLPRRVRPLLNLTPSTSFVLEYPSSSHIPVVDSDFLIEEVDTFLVPEDSIPPQYERFTFDIEPDAPVINNFDKLNEDKCFDPGGGEIDVSQNIEDDDSFAFVIRTFLPFLIYPVESPLLLSTGSEDIIFDPGIST
ncbi:hypothetical protein Tco_1433059 [Tanacetum coccineum]